MTDEKVIQHAYEEVLTKLFLTLWDVWITQPKEAGRAAAIANFTNGVRSARNARDATLSALRSITG